MERTCSREGCDTVYYVRIKRQKYCCVGCSIIARRGIRQRQKIDIDEKWLVRGPITATTNYSGIENGN